jgi:uncharacterized protein (TIGR02246 family)
MFTQALVIVASLTLGQTGASDKEAIRDVFKDLVTAQNAKDAKAVASFFTEDGDFATSRGELATGRQDIENLFAMFFGSHAKAAVKKNAAISVRILTPDYALADYKWEWTGISVPGKDEPQTRKGSTTAVLVKKDGKWSILAMRSKVPARD